MFDQKGIAGRAPGSGVSIPALLLLLLLLSSIIILFLLLGDCIVMGDIFENTIYYSLWPANGYS